MTRLTFALLFAAQLAWALPCAADDDGDEEAKAAPRGYFGIAVQVLDESTIKKQGDMLKKLAPKDQLPKVEKAIAALKPGLQIAGMKKDGPAHKAGLKLGDIITAVNSTSAEDDLAAMQKVMQKLAVGEKVQVTYVRIEEDASSSQKQATIVPVDKKAVEKLADVPLPKPGGGNAAKTAGATKIDTDFDKFTAGSLPEDWKPRRLGDGETAQWQIQAAGGNVKNVMQIVSPANDAATYNLCINENVTIDGNVILRVLVKPVGGDNARTGGIVWGYQNKSNFYMAVLDFKNNQAALYKIANGQPQQLDQKPYTFRKDSWTDLRAEHTNGRMLVRLDGVTAPVLDSRDRDFRKGKIGLVTAGDSECMFDEILARPPPRAGGGR